ncbi:MAG: hypothetical protein OXG62_17165 [Nitrospinae bacterium]|nr:hypothetical protein [Nitrospinota bacterium]
MKRIFKNSCAALTVVCLSLILGGCDLLPELGPPKESVSGIIRMSSKLPVKAWRTRTLFIIVEREEGGPPLAVQRLVETRFPYKYVITKDDVMIRGRKFAGRVRVRARLDADGVPGPLVRGDFEGRAAGLVAVGAKNVDVVIDRIGTAPPPEVAKKSPPKPAPSPEAKPSTGSVRTIRGVVRVAPALAEKAKRKAAIFIIARGKQPGPPLAVMRILNPSFPLEFTMSERNVMLQGVAFAGEVSLIAKLDGDGKVGTQPGDIFGGARGPVQVGARDVEIVLSQEAKGEAAQRPARTQGAEEVISGVIEVAPALRVKAEGKPVLFLIARKGGGGPPLAVVRVANPRFPLAFEISKRNVMIPGVPFEGVVTLSARLDADGSAGPVSGGDLEGRTVQPVRVGQKNVRIVIDKAF